MESTPRLSLPLLLPQQAQKHVTVNEALLVLDALTQLAVVSRGLSAPPPSPAEGARYLVRAPGEGAWAGRDGAVAAFSAGAWTFLAPQEGWTAWVADEDAALVHDGAAGWRAISGASAEGAFASLGIAAAADATNRLAVSAPASLFTHAGADHRMTLNKAGAADTASLLFKTDHAARAEIGLCGDDQLRLRVSDGASFRDALVLSTGDGTVALGQAGSAAAPALAGPVAGDGLHFPASGAVGIAAGGVTRVTVGMGQMAISLPTRLSNTFDVGANGKFTFYDNSAQAVFQVNQGASFVVWDSAAGRANLAIDGPSGRVGIATTNPQAGHQLDVAGAIHCTSVTQTSDAAEKIDRGAALGLSFVRRLKARAFAWRERGEKGRTHQGFFAEEVRMAAEEEGREFGGYKDSAVLEPEEPRRLGLDYAQFIPPLVAAVQELTGRIEALEAERNAGAPAP